MERIIQIQLKKITGHKENGEPIIEKTLIKLIDHINYLDLFNKSSFSKFVKYINANRYKEVPLVVAVIDLKTNKPINKNNYQDIINKMVIDGKPKEKINYKKIVEKQKKEIEKMKAEFEKRLEQLEKRAIIK